MATQPAELPARPCYHADWASSGESRTHGQRLKSLICTGGGELELQKEIASLRDLAEAMRNLAIRDSDAVAWRFAQQFEVQADRLQGTD